MVLFTIIQGGDGGEGRRGERRRGEGRRGEGRRGEGRRGEGRVVICCTAFQMTSDIARYVNMCDGNGLAIQHRIVHRPLRQLSGCSVLHPLLQWRMPP